MQKKLWLCSDNQKWYKPWVYSSASALLLVLPFLSYLPPAMIFFGLILLYRGIFSGALRLFRHGFFWSLLFFTMLFSGFFPLMIELSGTWAGVLVSCLLIVYSALYGGILFWCMRAGGKRLKSMVALCWVSVAGTWAYFLFIDTYLWWIFGVAQGCTIAHLFLPFAKYPWVLRALPYVGSEILLLLVLLGAAHCALWLQGVRPFYVVSVLLCILPFFLIPSLREGGTVPHYVASCGYVKPPHSTREPLDTAQEINSAIESLVYKNPEVLCICLPESSYPFALNDPHDPALDLWALNALSQGHILIVGAYKKEGGKLYNCLYCIQERRIILCYVKTERMIFTEYIPFPWSYFPGTRSLFLKDKQGFSSKKNVAALVPLGQGLACQPLVCSELFLGSRSLFTQQSAPLICLVKESWFSAQYVQELLIQLARLRAMEYGRDIFYIGHNQGLFLSKDGCWMSLVR